MPNSQKYANNWFKLTPFKSQTPTSGHKGTQKTQKRYNTSNCNKGSDIYRLINTIKSPCFFFKCLKLNYPSKSPC